MIVLVTASMIRPAKIDAISEGGWELGLTVVSRSTRRFHETACCDVRARSA
jgi:hypothetical protein